MYNILVRLAQLHKKQVDVIRELKKRGIIVYPAEFSNFVNGVMHPPKSDLVLSEADKILTEWEKQK